MAEVAGIGTPGAAASRDSLQLPIPYGALATHVLEREDSAAISSAISSATNSVACRSFRRESGGLESCASSGQRHSSKQRTSSLGPGSSRTSLLEGGSARSRMVSKGGTSRNSGSHHRHQSSTLQASFEAAAVALQEVMSGVAQVDKAAAQAQKIKSQIDEGVAEGTRKLTVEERAAVIKSGADTNGGRQQRNSSKRRAERPPQLEVASIAPSIHEEEMAGADAAFSRPETPASRRSLSARRRDFEGIESKAQAVKRLRRSGTQRKLHPMVQSFITHLNELGHGSAAVAWRRHFEPDYSADVFFADFCAGLATMKFEVDAVELWRRLAGSCQSLGLENIDPKGAALLHYFVAWSKPTLGGPMEVFEALDADNTDSVIERDFLEGLSVLGFFDDASVPESVSTPTKASQNLFPLLDKRGQGNVGRLDMLFLERDLDRKAYFREGSQFDAQSPAMKNGLRLMEPLPSKQAERVLSDTLRLCGSGAIWRDTKEANEWPELSQGCMAIAEVSEEAPRMHKRKPGSWRCTALVGRRPCGMLRVHPKVSPEGANLRWRDEEDQLAMGRSSAPSGTEDLRVQQPWRKDCGKRKLTRPVSAPECRRGTQMQPSQEICRQVRALTQLKWHHPPGWRGLREEAKPPFKPVKTQDFLLPARVKELYRHYHEENRKSSLQQVC